MTGQLSLYGRDQVLAIFFTPDQVEPPDTLWLALCTDIPTAGDNGDSLFEPQDDAYARVAYPTGSDFWESTGRGGMANRQEVFFPEPTVDWGLIVGWALCSDSTGGQCYYVGDLLVPERIIFDPDNPRAWGLGSGGLVVKQT